MCIFFSTKCVCISFARFKFVVYVFLMAFWELVTLYGCLYFVNYLSCKYPLLDAHLSCNFSSRGFHDTEVSRFRVIKNVLPFPSGIPDKVIHCSLGSSDYQVLILCVEQCKGAWYFLGGCPGAHIPLMDHLPVVLAYTSVPCVKCHMYRTFGPLTCLFIAVPTTDVYLTNSASVYVNK